MVRFHLYWNFGECGGTPSLPSLPGSLLSGVVAPDRVISIGQMELNSILMLNWMARNRNVLTFKLCAYGKRNCLK